MTNPNRIGIFFPVPPDGAGSENALGCGGGADSGANEPGLIDMLTSLISLCKYYHLQNIRCSPKAATNSVAAWRTPAIPAWARLARNTAGIGPRTCPRRRPRSSRLILL